MGEVAKDSAEAIGNVASLGRVYFLFYFYRFSLIIYLFIRFIKIQLWKKFIMKLIKMNTTINNRIHSKSNNIKRNIEK